MLNGKKIHIFSTREVEELDWASVGVDYVIDSTGKFNSLEKCQPHIDNGAKKVIITGIVLYQTKFFQRIFLFEFVFVK